MIATTMTKSNSIARLLLAPVVALFLAVAAHASAPGITGPVFNLTAQTAYLNQPDGSAVYSWGYGCATGRRHGFRTPAETQLSPARNLPNDASARPDADRGHRRTDGDSQPAQRPSTRRGHHVDPVPWFSSLRRRDFGRHGCQPSWNLYSDCGRRSTWFAHQRGYPRGHGDVPIRRYYSGNPRLLQRNTGRPADRDGALRGGHRAPRND